MKKWLAIPALAGAIVVCGVIIASGTDNIEAFAKEDNTTKAEVKVKNEEYVGSKGLISMDELKAIAVDAVGGEVREIELEREKSRYIYEVDVRSEGIEYDLDIDAKTGEVLRTKTDDDHYDDKDDYDDNRNRNVSEGTFITKEAAVEIAMKQANGVVTELKLDDDDGRMHYEIEIKDGKYEYEFEIDAITGEVLKFEKDRDND